MTMTVAEMRAALAETHRPQVRDDERAAHRLRGAAVLLALVERDAGWSVILQQRSQALAAHRGQIALPGGAVERGGDGHPKWGHAGRPAAFRGSPGAPQPSHFEPPPSPPAVLQ